MFADLFRERPPGSDYEHEFVEEVRVRTPARRKTEIVILVCWILIAIKHVAVIWAVHRYQIPFHQLWVNAPTWAAGVVATWSYYYRD